MAVVISGVNNNDKITATDGTIDLLSGVNFSGEVEVPSFKVGSNIQFGNAGIITATTLVGNLQGNINHTSNLLLQISGSEKFRVGTSGQLGIGGANYGTSGQVLTSGGSGSAASWTTITGTTINNNADNRIITGSGTANTLNGESNLTFDGSTLGLTGNQTVSGNLTLNDNANLYFGTSGAELKIRSDGSDVYVEGQGSGNIFMKAASGDTVAAFYTGAGEFVRLYYDGSAKLNTTSSGISVTGTVAATSYTGDGSNLTNLPAQVTLSNNADNRVITGGSGVNLNGESNFTYDGNFLTLNNDADQEGILMTGGDVYHTLTFNANRNIQNYSLGDVRGKWNGAEVNRIRFNVGADTTNRDEGWITFWTKPSGGGIAERLRIGSDGQINIAGILTATTVTQRTSKFYGVTTTERNALSPSEGDIIYNTTTDKHEFYTSSSAWAPISAQAPEFDNASGSLATFYGESRSYVTPTSPTASGDAPITYTIISGSLPSGMSINSSTGVLSGTPNAVGSDTTSNFTIRAANAGGSVDRAYSITVKAPVTVNYSYTGSTVNWSKPSSDVKRVLFRMWGGAGTHGTCTSSGYPGRGGKTEGVINVESHNNLYLQVGEAGGNTNSGPNGGWPNGGNGNISHSCKGAGGGGSSNIYHSSGTGSYSYIVAVAGGGGSQSHGNPSSNGGDGGGTNGQSSNRGGGGASQNAGGSQGTTPCGNTGNSGTGTRLQGGTAGTGSGCTNAGAGGGGGWWGGGAGGNSNSGNSYGGGGGGSGYFDTSLVSGGSTKQASESGWDTNRPSGIAGRASFGDNNRGGHGYITLIY